MLALSLPCKFLARKSNKGFVPCVRHHQTIQDLRQWPGIRVPLRSIQKLDLPLHCQGKTCLRTNKTMYNSIASSPKENVERANIFPYSNISFNKCTHTVQTGMLVPSA